MKIQRKNLIIKIALAIILATGQPFFLMGYSLMKEWKFIDNQHLVSNHGDVISLCKENPILMSQATDKGGYRSVGIYNEKRMINRLVAIAFIPNPENKPEVNHKDCDPSNNVWTNLEWATELENVHHAVKMSYKKNNGKHWKGKITTADADFIRANFKNTYTAKELSAQFKLDVSTIYSLLRGETWKIHQNGKIRIFKRG